MLQELVEAASDINAHVIVEFGENFLTATTTASSNLDHWECFPYIYHRIWPDSIVYSPIAQAISLYTDYVEAIQVFLPKS